MPLKKIEVREISSKEVAINVIFAKRNLIFAASCKSSVCEPDAKYATDKSNNTQQEAATFFKKKNYWL